MGRGWTRRAGANSMANRVLAAVMAFALCVSLVPVQAFAQEGEDAPRNASEAAFAAYAADDAAAFAMGGADAYGDGAGAGDGAVGATVGADAGAGDGGASDSNTRGTSHDDGGAGTGVAQGSDISDSWAAAGSHGESAAGEGGSASTNVLSGRASSPDASSGLFEEGASALDVHTMALMEQRDNGIALMSANYDYSGTAHCWFRNDSATDDVFTVEIDGESYEAYCLDPGLPAPANGWYTFYATWDNSEKAYDIVLDTTDADVHWSQIDIGAGCQRVGGFRIYAKGSFTLSKTSTNVEVSGIYSVAGAVYGLYWHYVDALASATPDYRLVIGESGVSDTISGLTPDDEWYLRELEAPTGFTLDPQIYTVPIRPNQSNTYQVSDTPVMDPNGVLLRKVTADGEVYVGEKPSLALAKYQFDYYAGYYDTVEQAQASGAPTRSWVLRTNENGYVSIRYADMSFTTNDGVEHPYLVSGEVYRAASGKPSMPFGTLVIHEVEAPFGYDLSLNSFVGRLKPSNNELGYEWDLDNDFIDGNTAVDEERMDVGSLTVLKKNANPSFTAGAENVSLAGARFEIYDNAACQGNPSYTLVTSDDGTTETIENLAPGSHWFIKEAQPPYGFTASQETYEAVVQPGSVSVTTVEIENVPVYAPADVLLVKKDSAGSSGFKGDATLAGAVYTFEFYAGKESAQGNPDSVWTGVTDAAGRVSLDDATLVSGTEWNVAGRRVLPLGALRVYETSAPQGYLQSDEVFEASLVYDDGTQKARWAYGDTVFDQATFTDSVTFEAQEDLKLFGISVFKEIQGVVDEISPEGIQFEIAYQPTGEVVVTLTIGADGAASTGERALPCGVYEVREVEESVPAGILPYRETSGTGSNVIAVVDAKDDGDFPLFQVVPTSCVDYTYDTPHGEKKDRDTGVPIANTEFTLYRCKEVFAIEDGVLQGEASAFDPKADYWQALETVGTDEQGKFNFSAQPYGVYMMVETHPEWHYMSASEGEFDGASADPLETARVFAIDKDHPCETQLWEDAAIQVECTVDKSTIAVTSAGLVSKKSSEAKTSVSNVGVEEYRYDVSFDNGQTNTYADEYWVQDYLNMVAAPYDLRLTKIVLPSVVNDTNSMVNLLVKTNKSAGESWSPTVETTLHASTLCDGSSRFAGAGWRFVGMYPSNEQTALAVSDFGLDEGEYLTGLCLYYGAVEKGFTTVSPLSYMVVATHALPEGIVIPNTATSHITRNWAQRNESTGGLFDDDSDSVSTTVLGTFEQQFDRVYPHILSGRLGRAVYALPQTGDGMLAVAGACFAAALLLFAAMLYLVRGKRRCGGSSASAVHKRKGSGVNSAVGKMWCAVLALLLLAVPLAGCSCSRQDVAASSSSSAAASALSQEEARAASASSQVEETQSDDGREEPGQVSGESSSNASETSSGASASNGGGSSGSAGSSPSTSGGDSLNRGSYDPGTSGAQQPAHEHSWEWVSNVVTVVDREGYDEPVYRWATWCYTCNVEVSDSHNEEMLLQGKKGHTLTDKQVLDYYIHHDAETHTEDHGYYRCSGCGATE